MSDATEGPVKIVILQRGWVAIGRFSQNGSECTLDNAAIIRRWGTTKGLGEIAKDGPTANTILDVTPRITYHELTAVATIDCEESAWAGKLQ